MKLKHTLGCCSILALTSAPVMAGDLLFSGFGSFIAGAKDHSNGNAYAGYETYDFSFDPDSLVGIQATGFLNEKASATVQIVSRGAENWDSEVDWAYVRYQVNDQFSWRLGRIRVPFYLYSDFVTVGFAYPWITPPFEVYAIPFSNVNGGDVVYQFSAGSVDFLLQAYVGSEKFTMGAADPFPGAETETRNQYGFAAEMSWRSFKFRYAYHTADTFANVDPATLPTDFQLLLGGLATNGFTRTLERLTIERDQYVFHDFAARYDDGKLYFVAEAPDSDRFMYYLTGGYRFGDWMALITYAVRDDDKEDLAQDIPNSGATAPLYAGVDAVAESFVQDTDQITLGVRWDFTPGMAFSAEVIDHTDNKDSDNDAMVTRAGIQVVF